MTGEPYSATVEITLSLVDFLAGVVVGVGVCALLVMLVRRRPVRSAAGDRAAAVGAAASGDSRLAPPMALPRNGDAAAAREAGVALRP